jgi:hypothetical protein
MRIWELPLRFCHPFPRNSPDQLPHRIGRSLPNIHPAKYRQQRRHLRRRRAEQQRDHRQAPLHELVDEGRDWPGLAPSSAYRRTLPLPGSSRSTPSARLAPTISAARPPCPTRARAMPRFEFVAGLQHRGVRCAKVDSLPPKEPGQPRPATQGSRRGPAASGREQNHARWSKRKQLPVR